MACERAQKIDLSNVNFTAKSHLQMSPFKMASFTLRARGTLISEPDFYPLRHAIFPSWHRENHLFKANPLKIANFPCVTWEDRMSQGVENRGSVISVPVVGPPDLDLLNRGSRFATIRMATSSQRFQIARFESQGQKPFESLLRLLYYFFTFRIGFKSHDSIR